MPINPELLKLSKTNPELFRQYALEQGLTEQEIKEIQNDIDLNIQESDFNRQTSNGRVTGVAPMAAAGAAGAAALAVSAVLKPSFMTSLAQTTPIPSQELPAPNNLRGSNVQNNLEDGLRYIGQRATKPTKPDARRGRRQLQPNPSLFSSVYDLTTYITNNGHSIRNQLNSSGAVIFTIGGVNEIFKFYNGVLFSANLPTPITESDVTGIAGATRSYINIEVLNGGGNQVALSTINNAITSLDQFNGFLGITTTIAPDGTTTDTNTMTGTITTTRPDGTRFATTVTPGSTTQITETGTTTESLDGTTTVTDTTTGTITTVTNTETGTTTVTDTTTGTITITDTKTGTITYTSTVTPGSTTTISATGTETITKTETSTTKTVTDTSTTPTTTTTTVTDTSTTPPTTTTYSFTPTPTSTVTTSGTTTTVKDTTTGTTTVTDTATGTITTTGPDDTTFTTTVTPGSTTQITETGTTTESLDGTITVTDTATGTITTTRPDGTEFATTVTPGSTTQITETGTITTALDGTITVTDTATGTITTTRPDGTEFATTFDPGSTTRVTITETGTITTSVSDTTTQTITNSRTGTTTQIKTSTGTITTTRTDGTTSSINVDPEVAQAITTLTTTSTPEYISSSTETLTNALSKTSDPTTAQAITTSLTNALSITSDPTTAQAITTSLIDFFEVSDSGGPLNFPLLNNLNQGAVYIKEIGNLLDSSERRLDEARRLNEGSENYNAKLAATIYGCLAVGSSIACCIISFVTHVKGDKERDQATTDAYNQLFSEALTNVFRAAIIATIASQDPQLGGDTAAYAAIGSIIGSVANICQAAATNNEGAYIHRNLEAGAVQKLYDDLKNPEMRNRMPRDLLEFLATAIEPNALNIGDFLKHISKIWTKGKGVAEESLVPEEPGANPRSPQTSQEPEELQGFSI